MRTIRMLAALSSTDLITRRLPHLLLILGANVLCSCSETGAEPDTATSEEELLDSSDMSIAKTTFPGREIPVYYDPNVVNRTDGWKIVNLWAHAFRQSWGQATGLTFSWHPRANSNGVAGALNMALNDNGCAAASMGFHPQDGTYRVDTVICTPVAMRNDYAIHEFGHVLGFDHEFHRKSYPALTAYNCPANSPEPKANSTAGTEYTSADPFSMMNSTYCNALIELSYQDTVGVQNAWGRPNYFADVTGDGADDAIVVNPDGTYVITNTGKKDATGGHFSGDPVNWGGKKGTLGTFFADVSGDGRADMIAFDSSCVSVSLATSAGKFGTPSCWTNRKLAGKKVPLSFTSTRGVFVADLNGDKKADIVRIVPTDFNPGDPNKAFVVMYSDGSSFGGSSGTSSYLNGMPALPYAVGSWGWFADVTGTDSDGKSRADYIYYDAGGVYVTKNLGSSFGTPKLWRAQTGTWYGFDQTPGLPLFFSDINGDGKQDYVTSSPSKAPGQPEFGSIDVYYSTGSDFYGGETSQNRPLDKGISAAKLSKTSSVRSLVWVTSTSVYAWDDAAYTIADLTRRAYYGLR